MQCVNVQVSLHCVQAYGHLRDCLAQLTPVTAPPRIMLHSYGGSPDMVKSFTSLGQGQKQQHHHPPHASPCSSYRDHSSRNTSSLRTAADPYCSAGSQTVESSSEHGCIGAVGERIYFSFSAVLCSKSPKKASERVSAVPDDRLLLETDLTEVDGMNEGLLEIAVFVAEAKGWSLEHTVQQTWQNFEAFYDWDNSI